MWKRISILVVFALLLTGLGGCNLRLPECGGADLAAPVLTSPADGATVPNDFPSATVPGAFNLFFDWTYPYTTCIPSAYRVDISDTDTFADISWGFGTLDGSETAGKWQLSPGCYYWRVAAYSGPSDSNGPFSESRRFCLDDPRTPTLTRPPLASIAGWVYIDENANDARDPGEGAISGAMLTLRSGDCPGVMDILTVESDPTGRYSIPDLKEGTYCLATSPIQQTLYPSEQTVSVLWGDALDDINFRYLLDPLGTITATLTETLTLTPTLTATPAPPRAKARQNVNCRLGPSPKYAVFAEFPQGQIAPIHGRNEITSWWWILLKAGHCWVWGNGVETLGDTSGVPVVDYPPEPTDVPAQGCWVRQKDKSLKCESPCPEDAEPGGVCTP